MVSTLITLIILMIVGGLLYWLVSQLPLPEPFGGIVRICAILICIIFVIGIFFGGFPIPALHSFWR